MFWGFLAHTSTPTSNTGPPGRIIYELFNMTELSFEQHSKFLQKKLNSLLKEVQSIRELSKTAGESTQNFNSFRGRYKELDKLHNDFVRSWDELYSLYIAEDLEKDFPVEEKYLKSVRSCVYECNSVYDSIMNPLPQQQASLPLASSTHIESLNSGNATAVRARLPKISIPRFSGDLIDWPQFRDVFKSLVHEETTLTPVEKFHYLIGSLSGEALRLATSFTIVGDNYESAWKSLINRYDNKRILAATYIRRVRQLKLAPAASSSSPQLRSFLKVVADSFTALSALKIPNEADYFKLQLALDCLDHDTRKHFEEKHQGEEFPTYDSLISFIQKRCQVLELSEQATSNRPAQGQRSSPKSLDRSLSAFVHKASPSREVSSHMKPSDTLCPHCNKEHSLFKCSTFKSLSPQQRSTFVRSKGLCFNCLRVGHYATSCTSKTNCFRCRERHHTLLHGISPSEQKSVPPSSQPPNDPDDVVKLDGVTASASGDSKSLLGTANINIQNWEGNWQSIRAVIDTGSQYSIITIECARQLGLIWFPPKLALGGVGKIKIPKAKGMVHCKISADSRESKIVNVKALVMTYLLPNLPIEQVPTSIRNLFNGIKLADERFWEPRPVNLLLGSDVFLQLLKPGKLIMFTENFGTLPTIFGHVVMGPPPDSPELSLSLSLTAQPTPQISDELLRSFWEIEDIQLPEKLIPRDQMAEDHFCSHVQRLTSGRYMVGLPLIDVTLDYSDSETLAMMRFLKLEARLQRSPQLKEQYHAFMQDYIDQGHMKISTSRPKYMIPHHAIFKAGPDPNIPPKLRVVFDASMKTRNGSLNENLLPGPKLQNNLAMILLRFRVHAIVFCTDIVQMFRQVLVLPQHRPYQCIFWRFSSAEAVKTFELQTVTYGQTSSSYLAIRTIKQLVADEGENYPKAAKVLEHDIYVDDVISGADTLSEAIEIKSQLIELLGKGCFPVHKWASNSKNFLDTLPKELQEPQVSMASEHENVTKILGMLWDARSDTFRYKLNLDTSATKVITKRSMLSIIARIFDPLGLLAPTVLLAKVLIQGLWKLDIGWDEKPPEQIQKDWMGYIEDLPNVSKIQIPRWVRPSCGLVRIFGFCDASERAYAAAIYMVTEHQNSQSYSFLLIAKTRLAPVKTISVPRLELCAAHLLTRLLESIQEFSNILGVTQTLLFTDSTILLSWLRMHPQELRTFVANRISYILSHTSVDQWRHVPSNQNPADIPSRGLRASELMSSQLWWKGPKWMTSQPVEFPPMPPVLKELPEVKRNCADLCLSVSKIESPVLTIISRFSNYAKLRFTLAYVLRFLNCLRAVTLKSSVRPSGPLTLEELGEATNILIRAVQEVDFSEDFDYASNECKSTRFKSLTVFSDTQRILRVGGRLSHSTLPFERKHPILLPRDSKLTSLIVDYNHQRNFHLGAKALQALLQQSYYIFGIRSLIRKRIWSCISCYKLRARPNNPLMADLPLSRVTQGRPFINIGVDFAGPYHIKQGSRRNSPISKAYMCMFVCMATKAVHIELVSSLSTEAFLAAFDRFTARRGLPTEILSDCGTNFVGAARQTKELFQWYHDTKTQDSISRHATEAGIKWKFNPPSAPHFGGLWEAAVKSAKTHLRKTLGERPFNFEELATLFCRIEGILNSRPLCQVSENPTSFDYLSPGHFLIGSAITAPPEHDLREINMNRLNRWQMIQSSAQHFWRRWSNEYVHLLQARSKWTENKKPLKINDLVLIQDSNADVLRWKLGRVINLFPDDKGTARVAEVRTAMGEFKRPVHRLAPLDPINENE